MSRPRARLAAWTLWAIALVFTVIFVLLMAFKLDGGILEYTVGPLTALYTLIIMAFPTIGALIASQRPRNVIGWLFCVTGAIGSIGFAAQLYADRVLNANPGSGPAGEIAAWVSMWAIPCGLFVGPLFLLFLFPDGSPGQGWRRRVFFTVAVIFIVTFPGFLLSPGKVEPFNDVSNPLAIGGALGDVMEVLSGLFQSMPVVLFLLGIAFVIGRFRASRGQLRQQMKWFAFPATFMGTMFGISFAFSALKISLASDVFFMIGIVFLISVPICSAVAILKYRLYEIDVIVNRTLVYTLLTAILAGSYLGIVVFLQAVLPTRGNDLAVVVSTLAVAALFRPLQARVQRFIDRRFYRSRYDAAATLDSFSTKLREQVDLDSLRTELVAVIGDTMQPAHASLWLKDTADG